PPCWFQELPRSPWRPLLSAVFGHKSARGISMHRGASTGCIAVLGALLLLTTDASAQPKPGGDPKPKNSSELYVIVKARLYEVEEAACEKVAKARWLSQADLEGLEQRQTTPPALFALLEN